MKATIKFSPAISLPEPFDVEKRIQELRGYLDPNNPSYQPEQADFHVGVRLQLIEAALLPLLVLDSSCPHQTGPIPREQTLAIREKFRKVGRRKSNHKPSTTEVIERAKNLQVKYVARGDLSIREMSGVRVSDIVFLGITSISVSIPISTYQKANPLASNERGDDDPDRVKGRAGELLENGRKAEMVKSEIRFSRSRFNIQ